MSRGFIGFLDQTILKLVVGDLTHTHDIIFEHVWEDITLIIICKEKSYHGHLHGFFELKNFSSSNAFPSWPSAAKDTC